MISTIAKQRIAPIHYFNLLRRASVDAEREFLALLKKRFSEDSESIPLGRARSGIYLLAKFAVSGGRKRVLMSPYTIPDIVTMVRLAGAEPEFYDFMPDSTACDVDKLEKTLDDRVAMVIVTHYHVNEPNLHTIRGLCGRFGALMVDDCAIAFGGVVDGVPVGCTADASIFSFSSFKLLNFLWGGVVVSSNKAVLDYVRAEVQQWPRLRTIDYARQLKFTLAYDVASRPFIFDKAIFPYFVRRMKVRGGQAESLKYTRIETEALNSSLTSRPALGAFVEWVHKLRSVDRILAERRKVADIYRSVLHDKMVSSDTNRGSLSGDCFVNFPILVPEGRRDEIIRNLMHRGFDVGSSLYPNCHEHPKFLKTIGQSAEVSRLVRRMIFLPTHFGITELYARRLSEAVCRELG